MKKHLCSIVAILSLLLAPSYGAYTFNGTENDLASVVSPQEQPVSEEVETVQVKINGASPYFAFAPLLVNDSTVVPVRTVMEHLNADVTWDEDSQTVCIKTTSKEILFVIGSREMKVNGKVVEIATPADLIGEVTYVPIRAVSEALGAVIGWDEQTNTASIYTYETDHLLTVGAKTIHIGQTVSDLKSVCGEPSYAVLGENGLQWLIYSKDPSQFFAVGCDAGIVCAYYTNAPGFAISEGIGYGAPAPLDGKEYEVVRSGRVSIHKYFDTLERIFCGVYTVADGYNNVCDIAESLSGQSRMGLDILNAFRSAHHLMPLEWDIYAALSSKEHATYMALSGELTHTGADGSTAIKRYLAHNPNFKWSSWGENICMGAKNIFACMNGWRNSSQHRAIMLSDKKYVGIGMVYDPLSAYLYSAAMLVLK